MSSVPVEEAEDVSLAAVEGKGVVEQEGVLEEGLPAGREGDVGIELLRGREEMGRLGNAE